jgi:ABC-2 type transport system permease protein/capsular polysaccharide transport system permease protein
MTEESSLAESFAIQKRVIGALLMREILTRYGRHNIGFLWIFCEPMMFTLAVTALWTVIGQGHGLNIPIVAFGVTGYSAVLLWRNMPNRCVLAVQPNHTLMHHRNIRLLDIYSARLLLEAGGATISFAFLSVLFSSIGWMYFPRHPLEVFFGWGMQAWFGCSLALFVGALSERADIVHTLWHPLSYIMFPLSGAMFSVNALPPDFQYFVLFLPMVNGVEIIREGYFGADYHAVYNLGYMASCNLVLMLLGMTQVREVSRQVVA